eukprot:scaffold106822_cov17-Tisochrysis_lutea.AAC.1
MQVGMAGTGTLGRPPRLKDGMHLGMEPHSRARRRAKQAGWHRDAQQGTPVCGRGAIWHRDTQQGAQVNVEGTQLGMDTPSKACRRIKQAGGHGDAQQ